jgi:hypothetical protein
MSFLANHPDLLGIAAFALGAAVIVGAFYGYPRLAFVEPCEAQNCPHQAEWREDHEAHLCDTHAEIPSYDPPKTA